MTTIDKSLLVGQPRIPGFADDEFEEATAFAVAIARHWSRAALPDDFVACFASLSKHLMDKAGTGGALGRRIAEVLDYRAKAVPDWIDPAASVEILFVVQDSALPPHDPEVPVDRKRLDQVIRKDAGDAHRIAELLDESLDPGLRDAVWQALAKTWVRKCPAYRGNKVGASVVAESELTVRESRDSDSIDLS